MYKRVALCATIEKLQTSLASLPFLSYRNVYRETVKLVTIPGLLSIFCRVMARAPAWLFAASLLFINFIPPDGLFENNMVQLKIMSLFIIAAAQRLCKRETIPSKTGPFASGKAGVQRATALIVPRARGAF